MTEPKGVYTYGIFQIIDDQRCKIDGYHKAFEFVKFVRDEWENLVDKYPSFDGYTIMPLWKISKMVAESEDIFLDLSPESQEKITKYLDKLKIFSQKLQCPKCQHKLGVDNIYCENCGTKTPLSEEREQQEEKAVERKKRFQKFIQSQEDKPEYKLTVGGRNFLVSKEVVQLFNQKEGEIKQQQSEIEYLTIQNQRMKSQCIHYQNDVMKSIKTEEKIERKQYFWKRVKEVPKLIGFYHPFLLLFIGFILLFLGYSIGNSLMVISIIDGCLWYTFFEIYGFIKKIGEIKKEIKKLRDELDGNQKSKIEL